MFSRDKSEAATFTRVYVTDSAVKGGARAAAPDPRQRRCHSQQYRSRTREDVRRYVSDPAKALCVESRSDPSVLSARQRQYLIDAHGDVLRGLQVVETACGITSTLLGNKMEVSKDMDTETRRLPLGVCASIAPFNFPA